MSTYDPFVQLVKALAQPGVRYVMIGVWAANYYAKHGGHVFATDDRDFFFPPDPTNLLNAWMAAFEMVWSERKLFRVEDAEISVARLSHI